VLRFWKLQCGHGEFAVENLKYVLGLEPPDKWLQCGHGEFAVENSG